MKEQRYSSGEEIHIEDRVIYGGSPGTIVFVIDRGEFSQEFPEEHWSDYNAGFMIRNEAMGLVMLQEADEDLELVSRSNTRA